MIIKYHNFLLFLTFFHLSCAFEIFGHFDYKLFAENVNADSDAPVISDLSATSPCSIEVSWDCSDTCKENLNEFVIYWQQTGSEKNGNASASSKSNYHDIENLDSHQSYTVWVASVKDDGEHNSDSKETSTNPGEPQNVIGIETVVQSDSIITISWEKTSNPCPIKGYSITWNGTALWDESLNPTGDYVVSEDSTSYEAAYLTPYTDYDFYVSEITADDIMGEPSDPKRAATEEGPAGPPESIILTTLSSSEVEINWTSPYEKNGVITGYHITGQGTMSYYFEITIHFGDFSFIKGGIPACGNYTFSVNAINGEGKGEAATPVYRADPERYHIECQGTVPYQWEITIDLEPISIILDVPGCQNYTFSVDAINGAGNGEAATSEYKADPEPPPAFTNFSYANISSTSTFLTWEPLDTLCPVLKYYLHGIEDILWSEETETFNIEFTAEDNFYLLDSLYPWSAYNLSIKATTEGGTTDSISQTLETLEDAAGPPTPINSSIIDSHSVWVSWTSPEEKNGNISGYHISCANEQSDDCNVTTANNVFSYLVTNLDAGVNYNFTVQAINGFGYGEGAETDSTTPPEN